MHAMPETEHGYRCDTTSRGFVQQLNVAEWHEAASIGGLVSHLQEKSRNTWFSLKLAVSAIAEDISNSESMMGFQLMWYF